jgi:hypothetical protein
MCLNVLGARSKAATNGWRLDLFTALVFVFSGILIGAGIHMLWREFRNYRRNSFTAGSDVLSARARETDVEVMISRRDGNQLSAPDPLSQEKDPPGSALHELERALAEIMADKIETDDIEPTVGIRLPEIERNWSALQACIDEGIGKISRVLAPIGLVIAAPGDPVWRLGNKGFGVYRRLLVAGESIGWLRIELAADNQLHFAVRAHREHQALLNSSAKATALGMTSSRASDLLAECLKPAAMYAAWMGPKQAAERRSSEDVWGATEPTIQAAIQMASAAVKEAGARLLPLGTAAWDPELRVHRLAVSVEADGAAAARIVLTRSASELEIAVDVPDTSLTDLGRRCRIEVAGITAAALAELIATSVSPAIAHARRTQILA